MRYAKFVMRVLVLPLAVLVAAGTAAAGDVFTFTDQTGRKVTVQRPVDRVVTIPIPAASMLIALDGGTGRLAGMHPKSKSALEEGILRKFFPEALDIRNDVVGEGFIPNVETLVGVRPDVVFQWGNLGVDVVRPLENAGLNVALFLYGTQEYLEGWIKIFGDLIGKSDKADRLLDWHHGVQGAIQARTDGLDDSARPRVLYFLRWLSSKRAAGRGTYNDHYIRLAGGVNPAGELTKFPEVSEEQIVAWDPEVILLNGFESELEPEHVYGDARLADVSAVKNRRVYKVPLGGYRWDPPNQESPLMWKWLAMVLHPDRFSWDLRTDIVNAYQWIYGRTPSEEDLDWILRMPLNRNSDRYHELFGKK